LSLIAELSASKAEIRYSTLVASYLAKVILWLATYEIGKRVAECLGPHLDSWFKLHLYVELQQIEFARDGIYKDPSFLASVFPFLNAQWQRLAEGERTHLQDIVAPIFELDTDRIHPRGALSDQPADQILLAIMKHNLPDNPSPELRAVLLQIFNYLIHQTKALSTAFIESSKSYLCSPIWIPLDSMAAKLLKEIEAKSIPKPDGSKKSTKLSTLEDDLESLKKALENFNESAAIPGIATFTISLVRDPGKRSKLVQRGIADLRQTFVNFRVFGFEDGDDKHLQMLKFDFCDTVLDQLLEVCEAKPEVFTVEKFIECFLVILADIVPIDNLRALGTSFGTAQFEAILQTCDLPPFSQFFDLRTFFTAFAELISSQGHTDERQLRVQLESFGSARLRLLKSGSIVDLLSAIGGNSEVSACEQSTPIELFTPLFHALGSSRLTQNSQISSEVQSALDFLAAPGNVDSSLESNHSNIWCAIIQSLGLKDADAIELSLAIVESFPVDPGLESFAALLKLILVIHHKKDIEQNLLDAMQGLCKASVIEIQTVFGSSVRDSVTSTLILIVGQLASRGEGQFNETAGKLTKMFEEIEAPYLETREIALRFSEGSIEATKSTIKAFPGYQLPVISALRPGLSNPENNCFFNAALQAIAYPEILNTLLAITPQQIIEVAKPAGPADLVTHIRVLQVLILFLSYLISGDSRYLNSLASEPCSEESIILSARRYIIQSISTAAIDFRDKKQHHDASEFLGKLLDFCGARQSIQTVSVLSAAKDFEGKPLENTSATREPSQMLTLAPKGTLEESLRIHFSPEALTDAKNQFDVLDTDEKTRIGKYEKKQLHWTQVGPHLYMMVRRAHLGSSLKHFPIQLPVHLSDGATHTYTFRSCIEYQGGGRFGHYTAIITNAAGDYERKNDAHPSTKLGVSEDSVITAKNAVFFYYELSEH